MTVKTRLAPSPTGFLHIGSLRTALYNYLYARKHGGIFMIRVEDTDRERLVEGAVESLIHTFQTIGLSYDEGPVLVDGVLSEKGPCGPYTQSNRLDLYKKYAQQLLDQGDAYYCFCSKDRLTQLRSSQQLAKLPTKYDRHCTHLTKEEIAQRLEAKESFVVRLHIPDGETTFKDEIRGLITINNTEIDDQVLLKADGFPAYHLAVVVDDHLMEVTHVIRGEEWISSVPKHIILYKTLGFPLPAFAHLPLILNPDKSKLSKRQGDVAVEDFLAKGYLPEALLNFVALLGFNPTGDREIYSMDELIGAFDLSRVNKSGAVFDTDKLNWMNGQYIRAMDPEALYQLAKPFFGTASDLNDDKKRCILEVEKDRLAVLQDLEERVGMYLNIGDYAGEDLVWKKADTQDALMHLTHLKELFSATADEIYTDRGLLEGVIKKYIEEGTYQNGNVLWPLRMALSGQKQSAGPFDLVWALGKVDALSRIDLALTKLST